MVSKEFLTVMCGLGLCVTAAVAQSAPPPPAPGLEAHGAPVHQLSKAEMEKMHAGMCLSGYAREVGQLSALKVRLQLKADQESAFKRWEDVKLNAAVARKADCMAQKMPEHAPGMPGMMGPGKPGAGPDMMPPPNPDMVKGLKMEESHLQMRLKEIKAEMPALEALMVRLSNDQKAAFMPPMGPDRGPHGPHDKGPQGGHPGPDHGPEMPR